MSEVNAQTIVASLNSAYHNFVTKLHEEYMQGKGKVDEFVKHLHDAQQRHEEAVAAVVAGGPKESDDDYKKRLMPIAGDESRKQQIEQAQGEALDRLGEHYNVARNTTPTARAAQPKDEADRAEGLAARNLAPENGTTQAHDFKAAGPAATGATAGQTGAAASAPGSAKAGNSPQVDDATRMDQRRIADDTASDRDGNKIAQTTAKKD